MSFVRTSFRALRLVSPSWLALLSTLFASACIPSTRTYRPTEQQVAHTLDGSVEVRVEHLTITEGSPGIEDFVSVSLEVSSAPPAMGFGPARLGMPHSPCGSGAPPDAWLAVAIQPGSTRLSPQGKLLAEFTLHTPEAAELLAGAPTTLDMFVLHDGGEKVECLRLQLGDEAKERPHFVQDPSVSIGAGLRGLFLGERAGGLAGGVLGVGRVGPWFGPVRIRGELGIGIGGPGASAPAEQREHSFLLLSIGAMADALLLSSGRFGLGVEGGYEVLPVRFVPSVESDLEAEWRRPLHGPKAGLRFLLLPAPPSSTRFSERADATSMGIELFGMAAWAGSRAAVPVFGFSIVGDAGVP